jgi:hypothetical protein
MPDLQSGLEPRVTVWMSHCERHTVLIQQGNGEGYKWSCTCGLRDEIWQRGRNAAAGLVVHLMGGRHCLPI